MSVFKSGLVLFLGVLVISCSKQSIPDIAGQITYRTDADGRAFQVEIIDGSYTEYPDWADCTWQIKIDEMTNRIVYIHTEVWNADADDCRLESEKSKSALLRTNSISLIASILAHASTNTNFPAHSYATNLAVEMSLSGVLKLGEYIESYRILECLSEENDEWNDQVVYRMVKRYGIVYDTFIRNVFSDWEPDSAESITVRDTVLEESE